MRPPRGRLPGTGVLVVGWAVVVSGAAVIGIAVSGHNTGRDELAGIGLALAMTGLMIVLAGNYIHHRAVSDADDGDDGDMADEHSDGGVGS